MASLYVGGNNNSADVKKLQTALINEGYDVGGTGADGIYGKNTEAAVKKYQQANGLAVDGVAGEKTQAKLYGKSTTTTNKTNTTTSPSKVGTTTNTTNSSTYTPTTAPTMGTYTPTTAPTMGTYTPTTAPTMGEFTYEDFNYDNFTPSENYNAAMNLLAQNESKKPGEYTPEWEDEADSYLDQYNNRGEFSYDYDSDALYQQYKDQYIQQGKLAMQDTIGMASSLTGGYGNSYAQSVGQQAYNQYLDKLNEVGLQLYDRAYNRYTQEGQDLLNMYNLYMNREAQNRENYQADLNNWYAEDARLQNKADNIYNRDWNEWNTGRQNSWDEYSLYRNDAYNTWMQGQQNLYNAWALNEGNSFDAWMQGELNQYDAWKLNEGNNFDLYTSNQDRADTNKTNAKNDLVDLITSSGYVPTDEELAAAGMSREQANGYLNYYKENSGTSKKNQIISWIQSGYDPTDEELAAAGMTRAQANAIKTGNTTSTTSNSTGGKTGTETPKYTTLNYDEQAKWRSDFEKAMVSENPVEQINNIGASMIAANVDPTYVAKTFIMPYAKQLISQGKATPEDFGFTPEQLGISQGAK